MKPRRGDVVEVRWRDSEALHGGWDTPKRYRKSARRPTSYRTAGYWLTGGDPIVLVLSVAPENKKITEAMAIPRSAVVEVQVLGRADKRVRRLLK